MNIAKGSLNWIISAFLIGVILSFISLILEIKLLKILFLLLSICFLLLGIFFIIFFRDPERKISKDIVASADGKIREVSNLEDEEIGKSIMISTFMNINNVHVNRIPIEGTIIKIIHIPGKHMPAFKKESDKNERVEIIVKTKIGKIKIIQIAGIFARRIVPYIKKGDKLKKGQRIGIIRLGSRVDLYLPRNKIKNIIVKKGDFVKAGETNIAKIND